jgi:myo-inositol-1(or 4)-monophosphatase
VTDWLALCRASVKDVRRVLAELPTRAEREPVVGHGLGGDDTTAIDRAAEDVIVARFRALDVSIVSEEVGRLGEGGTLVVIDPIDGSLNARRTLPSHSLSIAVASGPSMTDVEFGYVYDFGAGEEFAAQRGAGATLDQRAIGVGEDREMLEVLGVESAEPRWALPALEVLDGQVYRLRVVGSIAISACYVAAGRFDAMLSLRPCRSVDIAAAQLIAREAGGQVTFGRLGPEGADLGLDARYPVGAAAGEIGMAVVQGGLETFA